MMVRPLYPFDLAQLVPFSRKAHPNEASLMDGMSEVGRPSPGVLLGYALPLYPRRSTWVCVDGGHLRGVVSAKGSQGCTSWQVDYLQADGEDTCVALLGRVSREAARGGIKKVYLRLPSTSPFLDGVRRAGFSSYVEERLFRYRGGEASLEAPAPGPYSLRPCEHWDKYRLFNLYSAAVPIPVRVALGVDMEELRESRDMASWRSRHREFVLQDSSALVGWIGAGVEKGVGSLVLMFDSELEHEALRWLVDYGLVSLGQRRAVFCVAFAFQGRLSGLLQEHRFEEAAQYTRMVKDIAVRVKDPDYMPALI
ncbi:MAG: hypothetical protein SV910_07275 [Chloroflexota bacterium]|nr:hypothetical protein [Chloroflexota bacterium]